MKKTLLVSCAAIVAGVVSANAAVYSDWNNFDSASTTINSTSGAVASTITTPTPNGSSTLNLSTATSTNTFSLTPGDNTVSTTVGSQWTLLTTFTLNNASDTAVETLFTASAGAAAPATGAYVGIYGLSFNTNTGVFNAASYTTLATTAAISGWGTSVAKTSTITVAYYSYKVSATVNDVDILYQINGGAWVDTGLTLGAAFSGHNLTLITMGSQTASGTDATSNSTNFPNTGSNITVSDFQIQTGAFSAVPEPSTYGLIGAGALAAAAFVRRRRKTA